jgi:MFS family permease
VIDAERCDGVDDPGTRHLARNLSTMMRAMGLRGVDTVMAPVWVSYQMHQAGLNFGEVMIGQGIFAAATIAGEVPSGVFADRHGRSRALTAAAGLGLAAACALALASTFWVVAIAMALFGIATAMSSGAAEAMLFDTLKSLHRDGEYGRVMGKCQSLFFGVGVVGCLTGGLVAEHFGLRVVVVIIVASNGLAVWNATRLIEPELAGDAGRGRVDCAAAARFALHHPMVRIAALLAIPVALADTAVYRVVNPIWEREGVPLSWYGMAFSGYSLGSTAASALAGRVNELLGERRVLNMGVLVLGAGLFALSSARGLLSVIALPTLVVIVSPLLFVSLSTITNRVTDSHHRATVLSTQSLITRFGVAAVVPLFGHGVESRGMSASLSALAAMIVVVGGALAWTLHRVRDRRETAPVG